MQRNNLTNLQNPIQEINKIRTALQNLGAVITKLLEEDKINNKLGTDILKSASSSINKLDSEAHDKSLLIDLYITVYCVLGICADSSDLQSGLRYFFGVREDMLRGDSHDYCYRQSLANLFCQDVAKLTFPNESPMNVLLAKAMTENRSSPWCDETSLESTLDAPGSFFRTQDNCIHLYEAVVDRAIANIKKWNYELDDIWCGTDSKNTGSLTKHDLMTLVQRSPTIQQLFNYTIQLSNSRGLLSRRLADLRNGLEKGATTDYAAKPEAYVAVQHFYNWWNNLQLTPQGTALKSQITQNKNLYPLVAFIEQLKAETDSCVEVLSDNLQEIISNPTVINALASIDGNNGNLFSGNVDQYKSQIIQELKTFKTISTNQNAFLSLSQIPNLLEEIITNVEQMNSVDAAKWLQNKLISPEFHSALKNTKSNTQDNLNLITNNMANMNISNYPNNVLTGGYPNPGYVGNAAYPSNPTNPAYNTNLQYPHAIKGPPSVYMDASGQLRKWYPGDPLPNQQKNVSKAHSFFRNVKKSITGKSSDPDTPMIADYPNPYLPNSNPNPSPNPNSEQSHHRHHFRKHHHK